MITKQDLDNWFTYHAPDDFQKERYERIREKAREFAQVLVDNTPEGPCQTDSIMRLREVVMMANSGIACDE